MELTRKARRFFGVGKVLPERVRVALACAVLVKKQCWNCEHCVVDKGRKVVDTDSEVCRSCVRTMHKEIYGTEPTNV